MKSLVIGNTLQINIYTKNRREQFKEQFESVTFYREGLYKFKLFLMSQKKFFDIDPFNIKSFEDVKL